MKIITAVFGTLFFAAGYLPLAAQGSGDKGVFFYSADHVKAAYTKDPKVSKGHSANGEAGVLGDYKENDGKFQVTVRRKDEANVAPEIHPDHYHVFYTIQGSATLVTGGKIVGKIVEGGRTWKLDPGSVIVIPPGTVHWFKDVPGEPWIAFGVTPCAAKGTETCANPQRPGGR